MINLFFAFFFATVVSFLFSALGRQIALALRLIDDPRRRHPAILHQKPLPRGGGMGIFLAFFLSTLLFLPPSPWLLIVLFAGLLQVGVGLLDDRFDLSPIWRIGSGLLSSLLIVGTGIGQTFISHPLGGPPISLDFWRIDWPFLLKETWALPADLLILFFLFWLTQVANWSKGVGQLPGVVVITSLVLAAVSLKFQAGNPAQATTAFLGVILAGSALGFLPYNFPPERMLPGYSASTFLGLMIGTLSLLSGAKIAALLLVLAIPVTDFFITLIRRIAEGRSPLFADRGHLYHRLLDAGLSKRQIIFLYWGITAILGLFAYSLAGSGKAFLFILISLLTLGLFFYLTQKIK